MRFFKRGGALSWGPSGDFVAVPVAFLALGLILQGDGRVPLGDSWSFAWTARQFVEHGRMALTDLQAMTLFGQILLAWPVAALFSPTPSVLNHFTLVLSALTLDLFLLVYRRIGLPRDLSLLGVGTLAANPLWLTQSMAFETEIPFLFFAALGTLAFVNWDRTKSRSAGWAAGVGFAAAAAVRQHALVFPIAGILCAILPRRGKPRLWLPWLLSPLLVAVFYLWLHFVHGVPRAYGWQKEMIRLRWAEPLTLVSSIVFSLVAAAHYAGLFLLPVSALGVRLPVRGGGGRSYRLSTGIALLVVATAVLWIRYGELMPYLPQLVLPSTLLAPLGLASWENPFDLAWTALSLLAGSALVLAFADTFRFQRLGSREDEGIASTFLLSSAVFLFGFNLVTGLGFDRYLLLPLPFLVPVLLYGRSASPRRLGTAAVPLVISLLISALLVDQRVRTCTCQWDAAESLTREGIAALRINGGVAFNGYYSYEPLSWGWGHKGFDLWIPWTQPEAEFLVTATVLDRPGLVLLSTRECANLPGWKPMEVYTYRCPSRSPGESAASCQPF